MALLGNSSLHKWLSFNEITWNNATFPPCQYVNWTNPNADEPTSITNASCTQVCNDSISLFGSQDNLVTCGLWSTLAYTYNLEGPGAHSNRYVEEGPIADLLGSFTEVGLNVDDPEYFLSATGYADVMSACFVHLYRSVKAYKVADDGLVSAACTKSGLFPYSESFSLQSYSPESNMSNVYVQNNLYRSVEALQTCLIDICSPVALNPEFAGIGFMISLLLQSAIAIVAFIVLLALEYLPLERLLRWETKTVRKHKKAIFPALVSFHKAQCYFSSTVQVAALVLIHESQNAATSSFVDISALIVLATSGFIPVTFGLASIMRFGRQSWYLVILSYITFLLASANLFLFVVLAGEYGDLNDDYSSFQNNGLDADGTCVIGGNVADTLFPLCGSSLLNNNTISSSAIITWWVWAAWAICMVCIFLCLGWKSEDQMLLKIARSMLDFALTRYPRMRLPWKFMRRIHGLLLIFIITSTLCFIVQFRLIYIFNRHSFVSSVWSFGQIIAVTVWIPSLFEFGYNEYNGVANAFKHKYPSPLRAMRGIVRQTARMAILKTFLRESETEAVPLQSLSSAESGHVIAQEHQQ